MAPSSAKHGTYSGVIPERWPSGLASRRETHFAILRAPWTAERKRELKRAYREQEKQAARERMHLDEQSLNDLLDHLDGRLPAIGCDHTLRETRAWAAGFDVDAVAASVAEFGGYCDCEVLANVDPEAIF